MKYKHQRKFHRYEMKLQKYMSKSNQLSIKFRLLFFNLSDIHMDCKRVRVSKIRLGFQSIITISFPSAVAEPSIHLPDGGLSARCSNLTSIDRGCEPERTQ